MHPMPTITADSSKQRYYLHGRSSRYAIELHRGRYPLHLAWGGPEGQLREPVRGDRPYAVAGDRREADFFPEAQLFDYGWAGAGDYRRPAFEALDAAGYPAAGPFAVRGEVLPDRPPLPGLPQLRALPGEQLPSLAVAMTDERCGLAIRLLYTPLPDYDAVLRSARFENRGSTPIRLERAMSCSLDLPWREEELLYLYGGWAAERHLRRIRPEPGVFSIGSTRGISSHQFSPFLALLEAGADERRGEVRGAALVYSGNFLAEVERCREESLRLNLGIHPEGFSWHLAPGESYATPEAVLVRSPEGLGGFSERCHRLIRERLLPPRFAEAGRPILVNNWEATYFDFDGEKLEKLAERAAELGIELFVLDDGWFGRRDSDTSSLGDWWVNRRKLPEGLSGLAARLRRMGLHFGLWVEPEMISRESELFRRHPDWCLHIPGRSPAEGRHQLVLDLCRPEVREYLIDTLNELFASLPLSYVKWDMNRALSDVASPTLPPQRRGETAHRYVLGLYRVLEAITAANPELLIEGCAGGGGRMDLGMLFYTSQYWTSDNTDAASRLAIQYGTSILFPPLVMGAHVSAVPNHQTGRSTPLAFRGAVAMSGNLGYELDLNALSAEEREELRRQIGFYTAHRRLIQFGRFFRLRSPFEGPETAWIFVDPERNSALVFRFFIGEPDRDEVPGPLPLQGLDPQRRYQETHSGRLLAGRDLLTTGLALPPPEGKYSVQRVLLEAEA